MSIARNLMSAATPPDDSYKLSKINLDSLNLRGTTYPVYKLKGESVGGYLIADGGLDVYSAKGGAVTKYTTSQAYNLNTAVNPVSASELSLDSVAGNGYLKNGGETFYYTGGSGSEKVYQTDLADPYDISSPTTTSLDVSSEGSAPQGVWFKPDGTKMFVMFSTSRLIAEYSLTTAWDISTASATGNELDFSADTNATTGTGLQIRPDGSVLYMFQYAHVSGKLSIFEYDLSTAFDLSTVSSSYDTLTNVSLNLWRSGTFSSDGTKFYAAYYYGPNIRSYPLSTAWDLGTLSSYTQSSPTSQATPNYGFISWSPDGLGMLKMSGEFADDAFLFQPTSGTAFDSTTLATSPLHFSFEQGSAPRVKNMEFGNSGTRFFVLDRDGDLYQYNLSVAGDLTTATYSNNSLALPSGMDSAGHSFVFAKTGYELLVVASGSIKRYELSTAWDLSTATYEGQYTLTGSVFKSRIQFSNDGSKLYLIGNTELDTLYIFPLGTDWDVSTAGSPTVIEAPFKRPEFFQVFDGGESFAVGNNSYMLIYEVPTADDLTSCGFNGRLFHNRGERRGYNLTLEFNSSGTSFYTLDLQSLSNVRIMKYSVSTAYDVSTASLDSSVLNFTSSAASTMSITKDETHVLLSTGYRDHVGHYELTTPGDLSTISLVGNYTFNNCRCARFANDGSYLYVVVDDIKVYAYPLSTDFDISTAGSGTVVGDSGSLTAYFSLEKNDTVMHMASYAEYKMAEYRGSAGSWTKKLQSNSLLEADTPPHLANSKLFGHAWNEDGSEFTQLFYQTFGAFGYSAVVYDTTM